MMLHKVWEYLNAVAFRGEMTRPPIFLYEKIHMRVNRGWSPVEVHGAYDPTLGLYISKDDPAEVYETLYHEMCHQFIWEILGDYKAGHGQLFKDVYNKGIELLTEEGDVK